MKNQTVFPGKMKILLFAVALSGVFLTPSVLWGTEDTTVYQGPRYEKSIPDNTLKTLENVEDGLHSVAEKTKPAVVTLFVEKKIQRRGFPFQFGPRKRPPQSNPGNPGSEQQKPPQREAQGLGSGVIVRSDGYIVTNYHIVKDVSEINVLLANGKRVPAQLIGTDPRTDLAVVKIDRTNLPSLEFANSGEVRVGQWAIAIGSPYSLEHSVSFGHVSALNRSIQATQYENFIQTDAPINRGNSGGPLVNIRGEIIGINTLIQSTSGGSQGIGFASASNLVQRTARDLIEHGEVKRPWLGVAIQDLPQQELSEHFDADYGALISRVVKKSPADSAGLKTGDLVISINDKEIQAPKDLQQEVITHSIGEEVHLGVLRDGKQKTITVRLGQRPAKNDRESTASQSKGEENFPELGMTLERFSPDKSTARALPTEGPLLRVKGVQRGSPAHQAGIRPKDLILMVNRDSVSSFDSFRQKIQPLFESPEASVLLLIQRGPQRLYINLTPNSDTEGDTD